MPVPISLLIALEVGLVLAAGCAFLFLENRHLRRLTTRLQERMRELVEQRRSQHPAPATKPLASGPSYSDLLDHQIKLTLARHQQQEPEDDIQSDLTADAPVARRVAALRYALLRAERDAQEPGEEEPNWPLLASVYRDVLGRCLPVDQDSEPAGGADPEELERLQQELLSYRKRVVNLDKFRKLYFELEERWESYADKAETHHRELSELAAQTGDPAAFEQALEGYHTAYRDMAEFIEQDPDKIDLNSASARAAQQATSELRHLRNMAADQHRIIHELQQKLAEATTADEAADAIGALQEELNKQMRFAQESETCIQLLEDELAKANREAEQGRAKTRQLGVIRAEYKELKINQGRQEKQIYSLKGENQRLRGKIAALDRMRGGRDADTQQLRNALTELKSQYADLEERYLKLKLNT